MGLTDTLRNLDERILKDRLKGKAVTEPNQRTTSTRAVSTSGGDGRDDGTQVIERPRPQRNVPLEIGLVLIRVLQLVLVLLAFAVLLGMIFTATPTNDDNIIVRNALSIASDATGPFEDVFTPEGGNNALYANYALAIGVYLVVAFLLNKLHASLASKRPPKA